MAKNHKNPNRFARRSNRTESKMACIARNGLGGSEAVNTAPNLPGLAWKLGTDNRWSYVVLSAS